MDKIFLNDIKNLEAIFFTLKLIFFKKNFIVNNL